MILLYFDPLLVAPIFFLVFVGFAMRRTGFADDALGKKLLVFTIFVPLAATAFLSIASVTLSGENLLLPLSALFFTIVMLVAGHFLGKALKLNKIQDAVFKISLLILNNGFVLIFAIPMLGPAGVQKAFLIEVVSIPIIWTLIYGIAVENSPTSQGKTWRQLLKKILMIPPFIGTVLGLVFVFMHWSVPGIVFNVLNPLNEMTFPLLAISTGIFLQPSFFNKKVIATSVITKMAGGFALGWIYCSFFGITGVSKAILLAFFSSPVGFNTVAYSASENLDVELAASLFFTSALIGLFTIPAIFILFS